MRGPGGRAAGQRPRVIVFPILLDGILKEAERRFPGVETKSIQDDVDLFGDPAVILGEGGALDFILAELQKVDLKPNLKKFQAYTTSPAEFQAALSAEQRRWLKQTFIITDPVLRSQVKHAETRASEAKAAAADAPPATKAEAEEGAQLLPCQLSRTLRHRHCSGHPWYTLPGAGASTTRIANRRRSAGQPSSPPAAARRGRCRKRSRGSNACATRRSSWRALLRTRPRVQSSTGRTRASATASARSRKGPPTRSRSSAPRASSDAPITPPADQRRMASVISANDRFSNSFGEKAPLRSAPFSNDEFQAAARTRFGVRLTCLKFSTSLSLKSNAFATDKFVDAFVNEHRRAKRWTALLFLRTPKPKELQQLRALSAPKCHRHRRFCEMALPVIYLSACVLPSCYKVRARCAYLFDDLDLGFETKGCAAGRARALSVCVPGYLNLCFVKNDEEGVSTASPQRGTRRCHSRMSACFGCLRGWDGDVA